MRYPTTIQTTVRRVAYGGFFVAFLLAVARNHNLVGEFLESFARVIIAATVVGLLVYAPCEKRDRAWVIVCAFFLAGWSLLDVIIDYGASTWNIVLTAITCGGLCSVFLLLFELLYRCDLLRHDLQLKESSLTQLEARLQCSENEVIESRRESAHLQRLANIGSMTAGVAHDLNNSLTPTLALAELLQPADVPERHRELLKAFRVGMEHATQVVSHLQRYSQPSPQHSGNRSIVDLRQIAHQAVEITRFRWSNDASKQGVRCEIKTGPVEQGSVLGDSTELTQVVTNLLINAIEAMPGGGRIIVSVTSENGFVTLSVADEGQGMSAEQREKCFDPFFTTKTGGTGLGLPMCRDIVKRHGGEISVHPNLPGGLRIVVRIPEANGVRPNGTTPRKKVLCIGGDETVQTTISAFLALHDFSFDVALDGARGLQFAQDRAYDLVITNFGLPDTTGKEIVKAIKNSTPDIPVVVVSGWGRDEMEKQFPAAGPQPDMILEKPLSAQVVKDCLIRLRLVQADN